MVGRNRRLLWDGRNGSCVGNLRLIILAIANSLRDDFVRPRMLTDADFVDFGVCVVTSDSYDRTDRAHIVAPVSEGVFVVDSFWPIRNTASNGS